MTNRHEIEPTVMAYLLGRVEADERARLDERAFVDDAWEETCAVSADLLIEAYLAGALDPGERRDFEAHFLASKSHRERLVLLSDLGTVLRRVGAPAADTTSRTIPRAAWAAAAAVLLAALVALLSYARGSKPGARVAEATPSPTTTAGPVPEPTPHPTRTMAVAVPATPRALAVAVAADVKTVRFSIPVPESDAPSYSVAVGRDGASVWRRDDLVPQAAGAPLEVDVPADVLAGDAVLSVEPEATRSTSASPRTRRWPLRIIRR